MGIGPCGSPMHVGEAAVLGCERSVVKRPAPRVVDAGELGGRRRVRMFLESVEEQHAVRLDVFTQVLRLTGVAPPRCSPSTGRA
jgi:hypothetical protein